MSNSLPDARGGPQSVGRILAILESLTTARGGATLSELAVNTGAPKTSLVGLLAGLTAEGCLRREATGRYVLGPRFLSLALNDPANIVSPDSLDILEEVGGLSVYFPSRRVESGDSVSVWIGFETTPLFYSRIVVGTTSMVRSAYSHIVNLLKV